MSGFSVLPQQILLPGRVLFGWDTIDSLPEVCGGFGPRGVLVHGKSLKVSGRLNSIIENFTASQITVHPVLHHGGEPELRDIRRAAEFARVRDADWIVGVGGGSVMDLAKAAAGLVNAGGPLAPYQAGRTPEAKGIPFVAVPTTAGSGSEMTKNSVIINRDTQEKKSIRGDSFVAASIILDPALICKSPAAVIAYSGMDALTQAIESYLSVHATWISESLALKAVKLICENLPFFFRKPEGVPAERMLQGSFLAGAAFSMSRLGVVHGLAHPLGLFYDQPHGLVCAICLGPALVMNRPFAEEKYRKLSDAAGGDLLETVTALKANCGIESPFSSKKLIREDEIIQAVLSSGSTAANPKPVTEEDVRSLLSAIFNE